MSRFPMPLLPTVALAEIIHELRIGALEIVHPDQAMVVQVGRHLVHGVARYVNHLPGGRGGGY